MADTSHDRPPEPTFEHAFDVEAEIDPAIEIGDTGDGHRRIIPITGGTVTGRVEGEVLAAGADYQLYRSERPSTLVAKYAIETTDGDRIYVENEGMRFAPPEVSERIRDGREVDPDDVYFRSVPSFETAAPDLQWLTRSVFVATGVRMPDGVHLAVYRVA